MFSNNHYNKKLKEYARNLRSNKSTKAEKCLWKNVLSGKLTGERFLRQRPIGNYIVDFLAPEINLIIEIDGSTDKAMIAKFVESMPIADSKFIRNFMNENEPRLDMTKTIIAPSGEKLTVNVGFGADFFRPFF